MLSHAGLPHDCTLLGSTVIDPPPILKLMYLDGPLASLLITVTSHYGTMHIYVNTWPIGFSTYHCYFTLWYYAHLCKHNPETGKSAAWP